ncbi:thioredoxin domain-containing protein [Peribacillus kribbensis]
MYEFGDYKCPSCKMFNEQVLPSIKKEFVDTGKAKL